MVPPAPGSSNSGDEQSRNPAGESDDPAPYPDDPFSPSPDADDDGDAAARVQLILETDDCDPPAAGYVDAMLEKVLDHLGLDDACVNLMIVDDEAMSAYHLQYSNVPGTTDVLTFDMRPQETDEDADDFEDEFPGGELPGANFRGGVEGDLLLCMDEAARQAAKRGHLVRDELLLYAVHGLLHLLGEDDHDDDAYDRMHAREDELLQAVGVGALFRRNEFE